MDPFRHRHRNASKGLCSPSSSWSPLRLFITATPVSWGIPAHLTLLLLYRVTYPENRTSESLHPASNHLVSSSLALSLEQVLGRLVSPSSNPYGPSTDDLSPGCLPGALLLSNGTLLLEVGFTLRCLQRLSHPHFASLLCRWHDNSCTSDASTPVLSY